MNELLYNVTKHILVPVHKKLSLKEKAPTPLLIKTALPYTPNQQR